MNTEERVPESVKEILEKLDSGLLSMAEVREWGDKMYVRPTENLPEYLESIIEAAKRITARNKYEFNRQTEQRKEEDRDLQRELLKKRIIEVSLEILEDETKKLSYIQKAKEMGLKEPISLKGAIELVLQEEIANIINPDTKDFEEEKCDLGEKEPDITPLEQEKPCRPPLILRENGMKVSLQEEGNGHTIVQWLSVPEGFPREDFTLTVGEICFESYAHPEYVTGAKRHFDPRDYIYIPGLERKLDNLKITVPMDVKSLTPIFVKLLWEIGNKMNENEEVNVADPHGKLSVDFWISKECDKTVCMKWQHYERKGLAGKWSFQGKKLLLKEQRLPELGGFTIYTPGYDTHKKDKVCCLNLDSKEDAKNFKDDCVELIREYINSTQFCQDYGIPMEVEDDTSKTETVIPVEFGKPMRLFGNDFDIMLLGNGNLTTKLGGHSNPTVKVNEKEFNMIVSSLRILEELTNNV